MFQFHETKLVGGFMKHENVSCVARLSSQLYHHGTRAHKYEVSDTGGDQLQGIIL